MAGCVPVVTPTGALPEAMVEEGGIISQPDKFVKAVLALIQFRPFWECRSRKCRTIQTCTPEDFAERLERGWAEISPSVAAFNRLFK